MSSFPESGVPRGGGIDFTRLQELCIVTKSAKREDIGAMAHVFLDSFPDDKTARLLYPRDRVWPVVVEMLRTYLEEEKKNG